jgi:predicted permease
MAFYGVGDTFPTLGVPALIGRNPGPSDSPDGQDPQPVVMLHYRFWQRHFRGDPTVVGKTLELAHKKYTIIGISQANFTWGWGADVYLPQEIGSDKGSGVVVKLRPGTSLEAADAELQPLLDRFAQERPGVFPRKFKVDIRLLTFETTRNMGGTLYLLFVAVCTLLAIGCGNVSILLLAKGKARQQEFAVRSAVGASTFRIVRQLLTESLLLALTGTALGILLAYGLLALIVAWMPVHMFPPDVAIRVNTPVLIFSAGLAMLTTVLFGLVPALQMAKPAISQMMQSGSKAIAGSVRGTRLHGTLVAGQIALTMLLLAASSAGIQSFLRLLQIPLGYDPHNVISVSIPMEENTYTTWQSRVEYFDQLRATVAALPDVLNVGISTNATPPNSGWAQPIELLGKPAESPETQTANIGFVDSSYFSALRVSLLQGRIWTPPELTRGALLVLVNRTFVKKYYGDSDVVGHFLKLSRLNNDPPRNLIAPGADGWLQVIGVVSDALDDGLSRPVKPEVFAPYSLQMLMGTHLLVRSRLAPELIFQSIRKQVTTVNPNQQTYGQIEELEAWIKREPDWARGRLISALFAGFSILALVLSAVGLYSVASYSVVQRTNEFGIRMALGAARRHVFRIAIAATGISVSFGIVAGIALSLGVNRFISSWLGASTGQPLVIMGVSFLLVVVAGSACIVPARRAASVNPMTALRHE